AAGGRDEIIVAAELEHLSTQGLERCISKQQQASGSDEIAQRANSRFRSALNRLGSGEYCRVRISRKLGNSIEYPRYGRDLRAWQSLRQRTLNATIEIADDEDSLIGKAKHVLHFGF